jgi:hypothetical protein
MEDDWDRFVAKSRNGTFIHSRAFMDYHSDRFDDQSVLVISNDEIIGVFPAHAMGCMAWINARRLSETCSQV